MPTDGEKEPNTKLIQELKQGDKDAADELIRRYFYEVLKAADIRLKKTKQRLVQADDIAVSVFESLWRRAQASYFDDDDLKDSDELFRLLCKMCTFKVNSYRRKEFAQKRGEGQVRGDSIWENDSQSKSPGINNVEGKQLSGEELLIFQEQHDELMRSLGNPELQQIAMMKLQNYRLSEIAAKFKVSDRTIKRRIADIREVWERVIDESS